MAMVDAVSCFSGRVGRLGSRGATFATFAAVLACGEVSKDASTESTMDAGGATQSTASSRGDAASSDGDATSSSGGATSSDETATSNGGAGNSSLGPACDPLLPGGGERIVTGTGESWPLSEEEDATTHVMADDADFEVHAILGGMGAWQLVSEQAPTPEGMFAVTGIYSLQVEDFRPLDVTVTPNPSVAGDCPLSLYVKHSSENEFVLEDSLQLLGYLGPGDSLSFFVGFRCGQRVYCEASMTCSSLVDGDNCGACGMACDASQFCGEDRVCTGHTLETPELPISGTLDLFGDGENVYLVSQDYSDGTTPVGEISRLSLNTAPTHIADAGGYVIAPVGVGGSVYWIENIGVPGEMRRTWSIRSADSDGATTLLESDPGTLEPVATMGPVAVTAVDAEVYVAVDDDPSFMLYRVVPGVGLEGVVGCEGDTGPVQGQGKVLAAVDSDVFIMTPLADEFSLFRCNVAGGGAELVQQPSVSLRRTPLSVAWTRDLMLFAHDDGLSSLSLTGGDRIDYSDVPESLLTPPPGYSYRISTGLDRVFSVGYDEVGDGTNPTFLGSFALDSGDVQRLASMDWGGSPVFAGGYVYFVSSTQSGYQVRAVEVE